MGPLASGVLAVLALLPTLRVVRWLPSRPAEPEDGQAYLIGVGAIAFGALLATRASSQLPRVGQCRSEEATAAV